MARLTAAEATAKWQRNLKNASQDIVDGVNRVTEAPGAKAAAQVDKWRSKLADPNVQAKWQRNTAAVSLSDWKTKTATLVPQRLASGVDAAVPKVTRFHQQLGPFQDSLKNQVDAMPDITLEDSINRMTTWVRGMSTFTMS